MATKQVNSSISGVTSGGSESRGSSSFASELNRQNARRTSGKFNSTGGGGGLGGVGQKKVKKSDVFDIKFTGVEVVDYPVNVLLAFGVGTNQGYGNIPESDLY